MKKLIVPVVCATLAIASAQSFAFGGKKGNCDRGGSDMLLKLDYLVDLSQEQKAAIDEIKSKYQGDRKVSREARMDFKTLDPSASNYEAKLSELADAAADKAKQKVINSGKMRAEIHALLTPEQQALVAERKSKRMDKLQARLDR